MPRGIGSGRKTHRAEAVPIHAHALFRNPFANQPCGDRRQQDSAAKVSCGHQQSIDVGRADYRKVIRRIRPQACPRFFDARIRKARREIDGGGKNLLDAGCPRFVVGTWVFHFAERKWRISRITPSP